MSLVGQYNTLVKEFDEKHYSKCLQLLPALRLELVKHDMLLPLPSNASKFTDNDFKTVKKINEIGAVAAINENDLDLFSKYVAQLKLFYNMEYMHGFKYESKAEVDLRDKVLALQLLLLLSRNEIANFHSEMESMANLYSITEMEANEFLSYPIQLERLLMEGSYDRVWKAIKGSDELCPEFTIFSATLLEAMREEIANCICRSYKFLPIPNIRSLLFLPNDSNVLEFINSRPGWEVRNDGKVYFDLKKLDEAAGGDDVMDLDDAELPDGEIRESALSGPERLILHTLGYAREMEQII